jgi:AraC-like DNA-binding protein
MNLQKFSQEEPVLRMTYPGFVFRTLCSEGHDFRLLLADTGLTEDALYDPDFVAELTPVRQFFLNAIEQTGDPHLGVRLSQRFEASFIGLPAYTAMNASTFQDALKVLVRFLFLTFPAIEFKFPDKREGVQPGEVAICLRPKLPLGDITYFVSCSALIACEVLCRAILRLPQVAVRGEMRISKPEGWSRIEGQIGFPIRFDAPDIRLILPDVLLTRSLPGADPLNHRRLLMLCEVVADREKGVSTPMEQLVSFLEYEQNFTLPIRKVAAALGYSERGLRRHLERSGTSFRKLSIRIRERKACDMLANTAIPVKNIADDLGFESPSNFARSFKRRTGMSPSAYRKAQNACDFSGQK